MRLREGKFRWILFPSDSYCFLMNLADFSKKVFHDKLLFLYNTATYITCNIDTYTTNISNHLLTQLRLQHSYIALLAILIKVLYIVFDTSIYLTTIFIQLLYIVYNTYTTALQFAFLTF